MTETNYYTQLAKIDVGEHIEKKESFRISLGLMRLMFLESTILQQHGKQSDLTVCLT